MASQTVASEPCADKQTPLRACYFAFCPFFGPTKSAGLTMQEARLAHAFLSPNHPYARLDIHGNEEKKHPDQYRDDG
eukprot:626069-Pelagomonas_calceolata.AAC.3